jgi:integrase
MPAVAERFKVRTRQTASRFQKVSGLEKIAEAVDGVARCAVVVAAWTGLSLAELRGLKRADIDFDNSQLIIVRTVWHKEVIDRKMEHRAARVHLLPNVIAELKKQRKQNPGTTWSSKVRMFSLWTWQL